MMFMQMAALAAARQRDQFGFQYPQFNYPYDYPDSIHATTPLSYAQPQMSQPAPMPKAGPSDLERLGGGLVQLAGVLAEGYVKFVLVPKLQAEVRAELEEAADDNRVGDVAGLLLINYGLNKLRDS